MASRERTNKLRLSGVLSFFLLAMPCLARQQKPKIPPIRDWAKLPPGVAASHLIKKVAPVYPAFAKAAGIQGTVTVDVAVFPDGRAHVIAPPTGWACLQEAAMDAAERYVYRPFEKDGHPVGVRTTEDIVFKLPGQRAVFHPPPAPQLTSESFNGFRDATPVADGPPEIRKWVLSQLRKDWAYSFQAKQGTWKGLKDELPARMVEVPTSIPTSRIYIIIDNIPSNTGYNLCGTGACDIWWVVDDAGTVRDGYGSAGLGFYVRQRKGSPYPDIFTVSTTGPAEVDVYGYVNIDDRGGLLYCGTTQHGIHVCR